MLKNPLNNTINTAAIIGSNWGMVHVDALKQRGLKIVSLVDLDLAKAQQIAQQHNIAHACNHIQHVPAVDLVLIATPALSHQQVIQHFKDSAIICEKPLLGLSQVDNNFTWPQRLWVNYAFSQLASAKQLDSLLSGYSQPAHVRLNSQVNLPLNFTLEQWFLETTSHPLSWLLHRFGKPSQQKKTVDGQRLKLQLQAGKHLIDVDFSLGGPAGIFHQIDITIGQDSLSLNGEYVPGKPWRFSPVMLNQQAQNQGEYSPQDCWIEANQRSSQKMIEQFRGNISHADFLEQGGFDASKALWLEQALFGDK
ncbi:Gfo/Idh/MocA family oxidoreductase [Agarivorans sp. DSG3-1]|uniref:Gfo/Idh/MocA family oxidoreductase n=1 Tax=Agarivorans sp. DSG3-1 TaxID=3342249 RepID=UPI00398EBA18